MDRQRTPGLPRASDRYAAHVPATSFDRRGSLIRWTESPGSLPARVFVHGLGSNGLAIYADVVTDAAIAGHRTLVLDLPGHGSSDRPADFAYSLDAHADAVAAACKAAGVAGIDLVGHSLGGDTSILVAARYRGLVGRLVISEANLDALPASATERASQAIRLVTEAEFVATGYQRLMAENPGWAETLVRCDPAAVYRSAVGLTVGIAPMTRELFVGLGMPRTFMYGDHGEPLLGAPELRAAGVRVVEIPAAGHMVMLDNRPAYITALAAALAWDGDSGSGVLRRVR